MRGSRDEARAVCVTGDVRSVPDCRRMVDARVGRFGRPEQIAAAVAFVASDEASFVSRVFLLVDGGYGA